MNSSRDSASDESDDEGGFCDKGLVNLLKEHYLLTSLLAFIPFGFASHFYEWAPWARFVCNFFSILPMAWLIGASTEALANETGDLIGGLLNATFGNIVEMLLCIAGMLNDQITVVKCTLLGSILSNLLLVMGSAFIWGGINTKEPDGLQKFKREGAGASSSLLILSVLGIVLPTMYAVEIPSGVEATRDISRSFSVLLLIAYVQYLYFQLISHPKMFSADDDDDDDNDDMKCKAAVLVLGICTVLTACCSEFLIESLEGAIDTWHVSKEFLGIIVLPIIGNAAEHYTAIIVAGRDKMDLSLSVAVGSACQMALFATPVTVLIGWAFGKDIDLNFHRFQAGVYVLAVILVSNILKDGTSNWLEGSMLLMAYIAIAFIYYFEQDGFPAPVTGY